MAEDIVACRPVAYNRIGYRVEARDMELAYKEVPIVFIERCKDVVILAHHQSVESKQQHKHNSRKQSLLTLYTEH